MTNSFQTIYSTYVQLKPKENIPNEKPSTTTKILQIRRLQGHFPKLSILRATTRIKNPHPWDSNPPNGPVWKVAKYPLWRIEIWSWEQNLFHADRCQNPRDAKLGLKKQLPTKKERMIGIQKMAKLIVIFYQPIPFQRFFFLRLCRCNVWLQFLFYLFGCKSANMFVFFQKMREVWRTLSVHVRAICSQECLCINVEVRQTGFTLPLVKCYV